jgi:hypothetical protein
MPRTEETGFGLLLGTPTSSNTIRSEEFRKGRTLNPAEFAKIALLPTPRAGKITGTDREDFSPSLPGLMNRGLLPTPRLLKTPCAADAHTENLSKKEQVFGNSGTLAQEVQTGFIYQRGLLPTPTAMDSTGATANMKSTQVKEGSMHSVTLARAVNMGLLPTPSAEDNRDRGKISDPSVQRRIALGKQVGLTCYMKEAGYQATGTNSQLNPRFVAEMMGFPANWTELPFQSGETNQSKPTETP